MKWVNMVNGLIHVSEHLKVFVGENRTALG